jgi:hypothetical protein
MYQLSELFNLSKSSKSAINRVKIIIAICIGLLFLYAYLDYKWGMNTGIPKNEILNTLYSLDKNRILATEFVFETYDHILSDTLLVKNDTLNDKLINDLKKSEDYSPNHPTVKSTVNLKILLNDHQLDNIRLSIMKNEKNGTWYYYVMKETRLGDFYMRCYSNNDLGQLVEQFYLSKIKSTKH